MYIFTRKEFFEKYIKTAFVFIIHTDFYFIKKLQFKYLYYTSKLSKKV